uniref:NADH dehydrogenase subunit 6 n=1 Tax=Cicadellidae gen. sp. 1 JCX-2018 TaxID=2306300 RepID=A0A346RNJ6_9HEMI|nr:NADH dehydrogenase subunit 6 [Cicadellidae gen. sp. 1 JCX-2018]
MKMMMMKFLTISFSINWMMKTPMSLGSMLFMQTLVMTILMNKMMVSAWMPMMMFLMMIGGLLVLFMYMSSIASNEKFKMNLLTFTIVIITMMIPMEEMMSEIHPLEMQMKSMSMEKIMLKKMTMNKMMYIMMMMLMYLILTMVMVTKLVKHHKGPLRKKSYEKTNSKK